MDYAIIVILMALILVMVWPRSQLLAGSRFSAVLEDKKLDKLTQKLEMLEHRLETLKTLELRLEALEAAQANSVKGLGGPLSPRGLANYQEIQKDWLEGASIEDLCRRNQLLQGEVELILDLLDGRKVDK